MTDAGQAYLDNNATTALLPEVRDAIIKALDLFGNPSSKHEPGRLARQAIEGARGEVAEFIHARHSSEILFCSNATEAITFAFQSGCGEVEQILTGAADHSAVRDAAREQSTSGVAF